MNKPGEIEISPIRLLGSLARKWKLLSICAVVCAAAVLLGTWALSKPQYQSSVLFYISNHTDGNSISNSDMEVSRELVEYYIVMLKTRPCLTEVIETAGIDIEPDQLQEMLSAEAVGSTAMLRVSITGSDPQQVFSIAQAVADVLPESIAPMIEGSSAGVVEPPAAAEKTGSPAYFKNGVIGFCIGLSISALFVITGEIKKVYADQK